VQNKIGEWIGENHVGLDEDMIRYLREKLPHRIQRRIDAWMEANTDQE
jgi:hypothetical protein